MKHLFKLTVIFIFPFVSFSQDKKEDKWDVSKPVEPFSEVTISTDEGTWMSVDVSPDGQTLVFDMLGDLFSMPISGGKAKLLRGGHAWEIQPRFSPDGKQISFTSDAGGGDNIWIMDTDGSNAKQVTKEDFRLLNNAVWTPDGNYLIARKHFTSTRSLGAGEIWMYHTSGGGGIQLVKKKNDQQDIGEPWVSPDGKYVFYSEDMYPGGFFQYNKDPNSQIYAIKRYNMETGETKTIASGPGGAIRPQVSPDGKTLAFVRRVRTKSVLYLMDLETGVTKPVFDGLSKDQQEAWAIFGVYPGFNWMPDNKHIVIWAEGRLNKINTEDGMSTTIPFQVETKQSITEALKFKQNPAPDTFESHVIRTAKLSPDEKILVFNAAGYLYTKSMPNGKPKRLTTGTDFEFEPSFSPDGKSIAYVTWNDENKGALMAIPTSGGVPTKLSSEKGIFRTPAYSPNGKSIVFRKDGGSGTFGFAYAMEPGIYLYDLNTKKEEKVTDGGEYPRFNPKGDRIYYQNGGYLFGSLDKSLNSVDLKGEDKRTHFHSKYANQYAISPDGNWLAFGELHNIYLMPFKEFGQTFELSKDSKSLPVKKISEDAGINLQWNNKSNILHYTLGSKHYSIDLKDVFDFVEGAPEEMPKEIKRKVTDIGLTLTIDQPNGIIALTGAKIITMNGEEVIENGVVVAEKNRIKSIGKAGEVSIPSNAKTIDVSGKVIMPGIIDTHAHLGAFGDGISPQKEWSYYANLAFGITTTHDPSANTEYALSQSEMVKTGRMVGPRIFSTGTILYGADGDFKAVINNYKDAESAIKRTKAYGAFSVKSYNQPRREQRQQVIKASRENEIMVYPEGGSTFFHNMTMILDGHTSVEHNIPVAPLYDDVLQLWGASKTANTPTLIVNYGGLNGEYYWYQHSNVWENEKLLKYTPRRIIDSRSRHRTMAPEEEYENGHILVAKSCKALLDKGVHICVGGHGQLQGLGVHWEMWMLGQGGFSNYEMLRSATIYGAEYIGMGDDLGSLEPGKLADLLVLDKDPLVDIQNSQFVSHTMVNGRLFDTSTMNEVGNRTKERTNFFWEQDGYNDDFEWHEETQSFTRPKCICGH
ncbi:amidohydrolase family protein [Aegicerativicinus sediminis]